MAIVVYVLFWRLANTALKHIKTLKSHARHTHLECTPLIIAELHDIGKLVDPQSLGKKHNFEDYPIRIETDTWRGIQEHHCQDFFSKYPTNPDTFKLCVADHLASSVSRYDVERKGPPVFWIHKLWNPSFPKTVQSLIKSKEEIEKLISFIRNEPTAEKFFGRYGALLKVRTEEASLGRNVASLYTHSKLTGQFFRILMEDESRFPISPEEVNGLSKEQVRQLIKKKTQQWKMCEIRCRLNFSLTPIRARDLNVFKVQERIIHNLKSSFADNIFFNTTQEILLIAPNREEILKKLKEQIEEFGFWSHLIIVETQVAGLKSRPEDIPGNKSIALYPRLPDEIEPPICELCQIRKAGVQRWIDAESGIHEEICEKCWNIRAVGSLLTHLVEWEKAEQSPKVCWIKIWLDYEMLLSALAKLYKAYLQDVNIQIPTEIDIRFATVSEFQQDYEEFLADLWNDIAKDFAITDTQEILPDFVAVKINSLNQIVSVLSSYYRIFERYFPRFHDIDSPLKMSIVASSTKFPFSEIWRLLCDVKNEVDIHLVGKGAIHLKCRDVGSFLNINLPHRTLLHKIAQIDDISSRLGRIILYDREDRDFKRYGPLREAIQRYGHQNVLAYAKMMSD